MNENFGKNFSIVAQSYEERLKIIENRLKNIERILEFSGCSMLDEEETIKSLSEAVRKCKNISKKKDFVREINEYNTFNIGDGYRFIAKDGHLLLARAGIEKFAELYSIEEAFRFAKSMFDSTIESQLSEKLSHDYFFKLTLKYRYSNILYGKRYFSINILTSANLDESTYYLVSSERFLEFLESNLK